jgi:hypothetical protein
MSLDPRAEELLAKYPDQLDDAQLAELRGIAEDDLLVATMMDSIHEAEALLRSGADPIEMSAEGRAMLEEVVTETLGENPDLVMTVDDLMAPLPPPPVPLAEPVSSRVAGTAAAAPPSASEEVVSLAQRRVARSGFPMWRALAALLVLGLGYGLWAGGNPLSTGGESGAVLIENDHLQMRGGDTPDLPGASPERSELVVRSSGGGDLGGDDALVRSGNKQPLTRSVQFEAVLQEARSLALLGTDAEGETWVVYPASGGAWDVAAGANTLHPEGAASPDFSPEAAGLVSYVLVGREPGTLFEIGKDGSVDSVAGFVTRHKAEVIDRLEIDWVDVK